jgi:IPT/TIG domain-containing protein
LRLSASGAGMLLLLYGCGGGNSLHTDPTNPNPVPSVTAISPANAAAGNAAFTLTVSGSDFVASSAVSWNGTALTTTFVSDSQLTAQVPASDIETAGSADITVVNPTPGGGASSALTFTINASNPAPSITALSPASAAAGNPAFTLTVTGSDFVTGSAISWNGAALTTVFVSDSQLTAQVPASDIDTAGSANITVVNPTPGGGASGALTFTITASNPMPSIGALSPAAAAAGGAAFTLTVTGSDFVAASAVNWNGKALTTAFVSASQLTAQVPATDIASAGSASITVDTPAPGGGASGALPFTINVSNPVPSITALSPSSAAAGNAAFTLTVTGSNFVAGAAIQWNGAALSTTYVSASQLTTQVPASDITTAGTANVTVVNPPPGGGASSALPFTINASNPLPSITSLSPSSAAAGNPSFALTVTGSDFVAGSVIHWKGAALTTTYVSASQLTAAVPASDITTAGTASVTVVTPAPGGGTSGTLTFTINASNPVPSITSLSPSSAAAGNPAFTLMVTGSDFVAASVVNWNGTPLTTGFVSSTELTASVPASDISSAGTATVTVVTPAPGGGTSGALTLTINASNPVPSINALSPSSVASGNPSFTLTVTGSDFVAASAISWNGTPLTTVFVSDTELTAQVSATDIATAGSAGITVVTPAPGGGTSGTLTFTINASNPVPSITALSPSSAAAGSTGFMLTVTGSDFVAASVIHWKGAALTTNYVSASQLTAAVPASDLATAGTASVTVVSPAPGGGTSGALTFTVNPSNPVPAIAALSPASVAAGSTGFTLTVSGSDFVAASAVQWKGTALTTTYVSASQLTAAVPASDITTAGTASVTVVNPAPGGGTSGALTFTINPSNPVPAITTLSPASAAAGSTGFTLTVTGSDFVAASAVHWKGAALTTTFVSATQLTASVPASDITTAGTASVTVVNPAPGGGTSGALTFTINATNPVPTITALSPASTTAGNTTFTLTVTGTEFVTGSAIHWNGTALATTYVSASQLTASVPASDIATAGTASVTVVNPTPGGGTSGALTFTINAASTGRSIRQSAQYIGWPNSNSTSWLITLNNVQAGSTIYVVGTWPNYYSSYPTMHVADGKNTYTLLDRYDDTRNFEYGIQGTQSMGHWYAANVAAGSYTINMTPNSLANEDWVAFTVFEVAGVSATPLDGHTLNFQAGVPPGTNTVDATVTNTGSNGIMIAMTFDDIDYTAPTGPLVGTGFTDLGLFWDFKNVGKPSARAEYTLVTSAGAHTATFSPQESGGTNQVPNYMTPAVIFK